MVKKGKLSKDLLRIEGRLQEIFQPISPRISFVEDLRSRLDLEMAKKTKSKKVKTGLLVAGGIVGLAVMVVTLIRSLTTWPAKFQSISKSLPRLRKPEQATSI